MGTGPHDRAALQADIVVDVPIEHAFAVLAERFDEIKPHEHDLLSAPIERTVLEPRVGGTIYDVGTDGSTCAWARVLAFETPHRLVGSWDISPRRRIEPDPDERGRGPLHRRDTRAYAGRLGASRSRPA